MSTSDPQPSVSSSTGDSIFAAIEAGLKYIENNDNKVGSMLDDRVKTTNNQIESIPTSSERTVVVFSTTTESELSFLDLLLGDDEDEESGSVVNNTNSMNLLTQPKTTDYKLDEKTTNSIQFTSTEKIFLTQDATQHDSTNPTETTTLEDVNSTFDSTPKLETTTSSKESTIHFNGNISTTDIMTSSTEHDDTLTNETDGKTDGTLSTENATTEINLTTVELDKTTDGQLSTTMKQSETVSISREEIIEMKSTPEPGTKLQSTTPTPFIVSSTNSFDQDLQELLSHSSRPKPNKTISNRPKRPLRPQIRIPETTESSRPNATNHIKATTENIFSALFGGISNIFSDTNTTSGNVNRYKIRVNNDTNGLINRWPTPFTKITTTTEPSTTIADSRNITALPDTTIPSSTSAPIIINSNPSILESDLNYDYGEPTLPPSLPNLNIIPFLPTDAVKTNRNHGSFGFVRTNSTSFPSSLNQHAFDSSYSVQTFPKSSSNTQDLTKESKSSSNQNDFELFQVGAQMTGESPDSVYHLSAGEDGYHPHSYPSITEPNFDPNDNRGALFPNLSKYENNEYNPYGPYAAAEHRNNDYDPLKATSDSDSDAASYGIVTGYEPFASGEFSLDHHGDGVEFKTTNPLFVDNRNNQFSPPSETEGKRF